MFNIIAIIFIILAILVILFVVLKKIPALAILDVNTIPGEKENKFKRQIMKTRVNRDLAHWTGFLGKFFLTIRRRYLNFLDSQRNNLEKIKAKYRTNFKISGLEKKKRIKSLKINVEESLKKDEGAQVEQKLLEIINLDPRNLEAFFNLGQLYAKQKKYFEAQETYHYALKLAKDLKRRNLLNSEEANKEESPLVVKIQEIYFSLAELEKASDNWKEALENIREALEIEPSSPRYLDLILDLSIIMKDKELAQQSWKTLVDVNPENNKLQNWQKEIEEL